MALFSPFQQIQPTGFDPGMVGGGGTSVGPGVEQGSSFPRGQQRRRPPQSGAINQIMANRQGAAQNVNAFRLGGPEYLNWMQDLSQNATWY